MPGIPESTNEIMPSSVGTGSGVGERNPEGNGPKRPDAGSVETATQDFGANVPKLSDTQEQQGKAEEAAEEAAVKASERDERFKEVQASLGKQSERREAEVTIKERMVPIYTWGGKGRDSERIMTGETIRLFERSDSRAVYLTEEDAKKRNAKNSAAVANTKGVFAISDVDAEKLRNMRQDESAPDVTESDEVDSGRKKPKEGFLSGVARKLRW